MRLQTEQRLDMKEENGAPRSRNSRPFMAKLQLLRVKGEKKERQRKRELLFHPVSSESENLMILNLPKETVDQDKDASQVKLNAEKMFEQAELRVLGS